MTGLLITLRELVWGVPMLLLMGGAGAYLTLRMNFVQVRKLGAAFKAAFGRNNGASSASGISPRQALCTALAGTVGTGNIAGVAGALAIGGPGAIFWMWIAAVLGMATKYTEAALAVRYRTKDKQNAWIGGPMWYIERGLGQKWKPLSVCFCVFGALAAFGMGNLTQINTAVCSITAAFEAARAPAMPPFWLGLITALIIGAVLFGGARRVGRAAEQLVPLMSVLYLFGTLAVILTHLPALPAAFSSIIGGAFRPAAAVGGAAGITLRTAMRAGVSRGVFSNEAGLGSAPIAYASSGETDPARQGLFGLLEVFIDTIVLCTLTALCILCSGVPVPYGGEAGTELMVSALGTSFYGPMPAILTGFGLTLFALSSALSWGLYGTRCIQYLLGDRAVTVFRLAFAASAIPAAMLTPSFVWTLADILTGLMAVPNLVALLLLSRRVALTARPSAFIYK